MDPNVVNQTTFVTPKKSILSYLLFLFAIILFFVGLSVGYLVKGSSYFSNRLNTNNAKPNTFSTPTPIITKPIIQQQVNSNYIPPFDNSKADLVTYTSTALPGNALKPYSISYPLTWARDVKRTGEIVDDFTLTNGGYTLTISQGPAGGSGCIFEGEVPNGPFADYRDKKFFELVSANGIFRRFENTSEGSKNIVITFCQKGADTKFFMGSTVGYITYEVPKNYDNNIILKMDDIFKTIKEVK